MQASNTPPKTPTPFALSGAKNTIPETSAGLPAGQASMTDGFPPLTMNPIQSGGIPPLGKDFNGILFALANITRWLCAGGSFQYDAAFSSDGNVGGYPKGATLLKATQDGFWINTTDNNVTNPDAAGVGWLDLFHGYVPAGGNVSLFANDAGYLSSSGFGASLGTNGYQKLPSGMILQWGTIGPFSVEGSFTKNFPIAFPNAALNASTTIINPGSTDQMDEGSQIVALSTTQITVYMQKYGGGAFTFPVNAYWQAIGY